MPVDDVAREGFGADTDRYERSRPSYPAEAVAWIVDALRLAPGARVLDLGAGTGKFTRLLPPRLELVVADAAAAMLDELRDQAPRIPAVAAVADALPFPDASYDAITCAQAFHWFDGDADIRELRRALRPGGRLGLVWYRWDARLDHSRALRDLLGADAAPSWKKLQLTVGWQQPLFADRADFTPLVARSFSYGQDLTPDEMIERLLSASHVAPRSEAEQAAFAAEARALLASHPDTRNRPSITLPLFADCFWTEAR